jgi:homoaconitate hydratase
MKEGLIEIFLEAGANVLAASCGPCLGTGQGIPADGYNVISTANRNFKGRMGSPNAQAYLASPAVVAASAVSGKIDTPFPMDVEPLKAEIKVNPARQQAQSKVNIMPGFPEKIEGELLFCPKDNMNTDGIYPGKYTYIDDFTPEQQAQVVMENYDPEFKTIMKKGDILVGGFNFGTGSSREQAATALKYAGIQLLIAGSFSETYKRNAINNGFIVLDVPELVQTLKQKFGEDKLTIRTNMKALVDFLQSAIETGGNKYAIKPFGAAAQEIIIAGGLENWVKKKLGL